MSEQEINQFIYQHVMPEQIDVEMAKRIILGYLSSKVLGQSESSQMLQTQVRSDLAREKGPVPPGVLTIQPDLLATRSDLAATEALQILNTSGAIIACGNLISGNEIIFSSNWQGGGGQAGTVKINAPTYYAEYRLSTAFQRSNSRLASGNVYLTHIDISLLSSRSQRYLLETIEAFQHGLYLSATQNIGAANEALWMELGRSCFAAYPGAEELKKALQGKNPSISSIIENAWKTLSSNLQSTLSRVLSPGIDQILFKQMADRLRDRRNDAMHGDAAPDEAMFSYVEVGLLLLDASDYFNQLGRIIAEVKGLAFPSLLP